MDLVWLLVIMDQKPGTPCKMNQEPLPVSENLSPVTPATAIYVSM